LSEWFTFTPTIYKSEASNNNKFQGHIMSSDAISWFFCRSD